MSIFNSSRRRNAKSIRTFYVDISEVQQPVEKSTLKPPAGVKIKSPMHIKCASDPLLSETCLSKSISVSRSSKVRKLSQLSSNVTIDLSKPRSQRTVQEKEPEYEEYFESTLRTLQRCQEILSISMLDIVPKQVTLPNVNAKKTVIFDLDETLVHAVQDATQAERQIELVLPNGELSRIGIKFRPFVKQCLEQASQLFEVIVFTASDKTYADTVLNYLDPKRKLIHHRLYREHCVHVKYGMVKDLRIFINRDIKDLIMVDNSCLSFASQIENGVPIRSWLGNPNDRELLKLMSYLKELRNQRDVRDLNRRKFRLCTFDQQQVNLKFS